MIKKDNFLVAFLKGLVRLVIRVFYGNKFKKKRTMHDINFLAPKSENLYEQKKRRISA
jgi:hypothetical protein